MNLNLNDYRKKVLGCWMGKNIGGTLGAPFEWRRQVNQVNFYVQDLGGEPLPNDDLDIQLLWLVALEERGIDIDAQVLSEYWVSYVTPHWSEYGTAKINMRAGLPAPLCGTFGNDYKDSCGAFIRSEIWACIAPGAPQIAARYAYEDAILDHGNGEGTYAEVFIAALESAAFVESDIYKLIDIALTYIPRDCGVAGAVKCAINAYRSGKPWLEARDAVLAGYRGSTFFGFPAHTSLEDTQKGYAEGKRGWDVPSNIGMLLIGLLYGEGDFARSLTTAVNCGEDTDCTAATAGSIFGIIHGIDAIPEQWITPIGRTIKTACLNLGELGYFGNQLPRDVDVLTERTMNIASQVSLRHNLPLAISDRPTDLTGLHAVMLHGDQLCKTLYANMNGPVFRFLDFEVSVDYGAQGPVIRDNLPATVRLHIRNTYKIQANLGLHWYLPDGWKVSPSADGALLALPSHMGEPLEVTFTLEAPAIRAPMNRAVVELTIAGRPTVMLVPLTLLNGNLL
ncbi:MAG: ADP-ribosylglycohydrolase family protein [Chloroflexi bacterium]|nr:ADP-ribosylglycohydrolase family protein [Chloroflexota bacterium]